MQLPQKPRSKASQRGRLSSGNPAADIREHLWLESTRLITSTMLREVSASTCKSGERAGGRRTNSSAHVPPTPSPGLGTDRSDVISSVSSQYVVATAAQAHASGEIGTSASPAALKEGSIKELPVCDPRSSTNLSLAANKQLSGCLSWALIKPCQSSVGYRPANRSVAPAHAVPAHRQGVGSKVRRI
ncbi:hypothetical protein SRHO_G00213900 [Serrasalmus rhombeus]